MYSSISGKIILKMIENNNTNDQNSGNEEENKLNKKLPSISEPGSESNLKNNQINPEEENSTLNSEEPLKDKPIEKLFIENHHPTGDPESTAGWFVSDIDSFLSQPDSIEKRFRKHQTYSCEAK
jgi:hypothetical protein